MNPNVMFNDVTVERGGPSWRQYNNCNGQQLQSCVASLTKQCNQAQSVVSKVVRLSTDLVESLLLRVPTLKVIYIFRDPRPIVISRHANWPRPFWNKTDAALSLCERISSDLLVSRTLKKKYPERFVIVSYEMLANRPFQTTSSIFTDFGMNLTNLDKKMIKYLTEAEVEMAGTWNGVRSNSSETANLWRKSIKTDDRNSITTACFSAFHLMADYMSYPIV